MLCIKLHLYPEETYSMYFKVFAGDTNSFLFYNNYITRCQSIYYIILWTIKLYNYFKLLFLTWLHRIRPISGTFYFVKTNIHFRCLLNLYNQPTVEYHRPWVKIRNLTSRVICFLPFFLFSEKYCQSWGRIQAALKNHLFLSKDRNICLDQFLVKFQRNMT